MLVLNENSSFIKQNHSSFRHSLPCISIRHINLFENHGNSVIYFQFILILYDTLFLDEWIKRREGFNLSSWFSEWRLSYCHIQLFIERKMLTMFKLKTVTMVFLAT